MLSILSTERKVRQRVPVEDVVLHECTSRQNGLDEKQKYSVIVLDILSQW